MLESRSGDNIVFVAENSEIKFIVSSKEDLSSAMVLAIDKKTSRTLSSVYGGKAISLTGLPMIESYIDINEDVYSIQCVLK